MSGLETKLFIPTMPNNGHVRELEKFFGDLTRGYVDIPTSMSIVFICYTNRSGSNYLAELLSSDRHYNLAGEDLNHDTVVQHSKRRGLRSLQEYFNYLVRIKSRSNVLLIKSAVEHIELLGRTGILEQLYPVSHFVLIERVDKLAQAISLSIAFQTGKYTSGMAGSKDENDLTFDAQRITGIIGGIAEHHKQFDIFFARNGIAPHTILYENLISDPVGLVGAMASKVGLSDLSINLGGVGIMRQTGAINEEWRRLYLTNQPL